DVCRYDLLVRLDGFGAQLVALDVADAGSAGGQAADGADDAALAGRRGDHAGKVACLVFPEDELDVLRQELRGVALARVFRVEVALLVNAVVLARADLVVNADEPDVRVRLGCGDRGRN